MKRIIDTEENALESLLGETVLVMCVNYFYEGKLTAVNSTAIELELPAIVYNTGPWTEDGWQDSQSLPAKKIFISINAVESIGVYRA